MLTSEIQNDIKIVLKYSVYQSVGNGKNNLFFSKYSESIIMKFVSQESSFQGLSNDILFFCFCTAVEELLKKEN